VRLAAVARALNSSGSGFDLDTLNVADTEKYLYYTTSLANNKLDKFLKANIQENDTAMSDLIGTKYMRLCQWDKAIAWLNTVPISYYNNNRSKGYLYYSLIRQWDVEPWAKRQWLDEDKAWEKDYKWWKHRKLDFCKEVQMMENSLNMLSGKALEQSCYNLAVRYAQASIHGDCWWLLRDFKSCMDSVRVHEVDLGQKAVKMLQKAAASTDLSLKRKALFALGYRELYNDVKGLSHWYTVSWEAGESVQAYHRNAPQFQAYQALYELTGDEAAMSETFWSTLEQVGNQRVVWQNLIGYFAEHRFFSPNLGAPALNEMFFDTTEYYQNIDKGRPSYQRKAKKWARIQPLLDRFVPRKE
jgi:hypothetical protein